jgi:AraC-like DNA-binding protein
VLKIRKYAKPQNVSGQAMTTTNKINFDRMIIESKKVSVRQKEIVSQYLQQLDQHLTELKKGKSEKTFKIKDLADLLFVSPKHLSNTIQEVLGKSPFDIYEERLILTYCTYIDF